LTLSNPERPITSDKPCDLVSFAIVQEHQGLKNPLVLCIFHHKRIAGELAAQTKPLNDTAIAIFIALAEITQQAAAATDQFQQAAPRVMVVNMGAQMFNQLQNPLGEQGNLHLGRTGIGSMHPIILNDCCFFLFFERHGFLLDNRAQAGAAWRSAFLPCAL
jgi:hypothetical protein